MTNTWFTEHVIAWSDERFQIEHMRSSGMFSWLRVTGGAAVLDAMVTQHHDHDFVAEKVRRKRKIEEARASSIYLRTARPTIKIPRTKKYVRY